MIYSTQIHTKKTSACALNAERVIMKILLIEWASFGNADIKDAFAKEGHQVVSFPFSRVFSRLFSIAISALIFDLV